MNDQDLTNYPLAKAKLDKLMETLAGKPFIEGVPPKINIFNELLMAHAVHRTDAEELYRIIFKTLEKVTGINLREEKDISDKRFQEFIEILKNQQKTQNNLVQELRTFNEIFSKKNIKQYKKLAEELNQFDKKIKKKIGFNLEIIADSINSFNENCEKMGDLNVLLNEFSGNQKQRNTKVEVKNDKPIYNYIKKRVEPKKGIKAVFLHEKNEICDIWFILEDEDFSLELLISELIGDLFDIFDEILFDSLSFTSDEINIEDLKKESYDIIFLRE